MFEITEAETTDAEVLTEINFDGKAYWGFSKHQLAEWTDVLTITPDYLSENQVYKLIADSEIAGYYSYIILSDKEILLDNLFIRQKYIGKGFGKLLMLDFLLKVKQFTTIKLESEPAAEAFYKKFGFKTYSRKESVIKGRFLPKMELLQESF